MVSLYRERINVEGVDEELNLMTVHVLLLLDGQGIGDAMFSGGAW